MYLMVKNKGFTLVELLVAVTLASIIMVGLIGAFLSFLQHQTLAQQKRNVLNSIKFAIEDISRDLYFGREYRCGNFSTLVSSSSPPVTTNVCDCIVFTDQLNRRTKIKVINVSNDGPGVINKRVSRIDTDNSCAAIEGWVPISSSVVDISYLTFDIQQDPGKQPNVKVGLSANYEIDKEKQTFTTKSQITRRILEPTQTAASQFLVGTSSSFIQANEYYSKIGGSTCKNNEDPPKIVNDIFCGATHHPLKVNSVNGGYLLLASNGLVYRYSGRRPYSFKIDGSSKGIFDDEIPKNIVDIFGTTLGAKRFFTGSDGSLYKVKIVKNGVESGIIFNADTHIGSERILAGGGNANSISKLEFSNGLVFIRYRDEDGVNAFIVTTDNYLDRIFNKPNTCASIQNQTINISRAQDCFILEGVATLNPPYSKTLKIIKNIPASSVREVFATRSVTGTPGNRDLHFLYTKNNENRHLTLIPGFNNPEDFELTDERLLNATKPFHNFYITANGDRLSGNGVLFICKSDRSSICIYSIRNRSIYEYRTGQTNIIDLSYFKIGNRIFPIFINGNGNLYILDSEGAKKILKLEFDLTPQTDEDDAFKGFCGIEPNEDNIDSVSLLEITENNDYNSSPLIGKVDTGSDNIRTDVFRIYTSSNENLNRHTECPTIGHQFVKLKGEGNVKTFNGQHIYIERIPDIELNYDEYD